MGNVQKLPVNAFMWVGNRSEFNEGFIKSYKEDSNEETFFGVDVQYPKMLHDLHHDLKYLPWKNNNIFSPISTIKKRVMHMNQALNHGWLLKKVHRMIKLNQKSWLN